MNTFVSGESDARGYFSLILRLTGQTWQSAAPELWNAWNLARPGIAWQGVARQGKESGGARLGPARPGAARQGRARHEQGKESGKARLGAAGQGLAWQGTWAGVTTSKHKTHTEHGNNTTQH